MPDLGVELDEEAAVAEGAGPDREAVGDVAGPDDLAAARLPEEKGSRSWGAGDGAMAMVALMVTAEAGVTGMVRKACCYLRLTGRLESRLGGKKKARDERWAPGAMDGECTPAVPKGQSTLSLFYFDFSCRLTTPPARVANKFGWRLDGQQPSRFRCHDG